ncbi:MAG: GNAT family N-acetyltransferase [Chitinophagaceae bacterium]|nr:GNAT family N-acetyltransferase [Chitinophagaceae bacterium]
MESEYSIRKATIKDVDFLAEVIIGAEKSLTNNLGIANFFELTEEKVKELIIAMLEEEVDGCDFSISSFFIAFYGDKPVGALGGWIEGYFDGMSSNLLKSNLISFNFPKENLQKAQGKMDMIKEMLHIERPMGTYQLEYVYVDNDHRGKRITQQLMDVHLAYAKQLDPNVTKAQLSCFENNESIIRAHERNGYQRIKRYVCDNEDILKYLPFNVKVLLEKTF